MDYENEKQFLADLEKAMALSLETLELEKIRKNKINNGPSAEISREDIQKYKNYLTSKQRAYSENLSVSLAPPPIPVRRPITPTNNQHQSQTLQSSAKIAEKKKDECDLMSFNTLPNPKEENHKDLVQLVHNMHMDIKTQRSHSVTSASSSFGFTPQLHQMAPVLQQQQSQTGMQIVPYVDPNKPVPLTKEVLDILYSKPAHQQHHQQVNTFVPTIPNFHNYQPPAPNPIFPQFPTANFGYQTQQQQPTPPPQSFQQPFASNSNIINNNNNAIMPLPELPPKHTRPLPPGMPSVNPKLGATKRSKSLHHEPNYVSEVVLRPKSDNASTKLCEDLIDLGNGIDDSRVSVLEAFDPLLCGNRWSCEDDKADNASSYYSEYDPFDYIYSGGTQYSDPVYDAVTRSDKTPMSPNSESEPASEVFSLNDPPPLPPRNTEIDYAPIEQSGESPYVVMNKVSLDRRKAPTKLYENVVIKKSYDKELIAFYDMVKKVRSTYKYDDLVTNVGHVVAAECDYRYDDGISIKILVHPSFHCLNTRNNSNNKGQIEGYGPPISFTSDISSTVEHVIMHVWCSLENRYSDLVTDYVLKPIGIQEILSPQSKLSQLECVHNSIKLEQDVQLGLCPKTSKIMKGIGRTPQDDLRDADLKLEDILAKEASLSIGYDDLMILLETLEAEIDKLECSANDTKSHNVFSCSGVVQAVKAICNLLGPIDTIEISDAIDNLKSVCSSGQSVYGFRDNSMYNSGSLSIMSESGDYAEVSLNPQSIGSQIKYRCSEVRNSIQCLLEIYSHAFQVNFCVDVPDWNTDPIPILNILNPVTVNIMCLHRPPVDWEYDDYILGVQIYHGTRYISEAIVTQCSNEITGIYPRLKFNSQLKFRNIAVCTLPRESRLIFVLYGSTTKPAEGAAAEEEEASQEGKIRKVELGWASLQFFDFERRMIQGSHLLSLWPPTSEKYFGPAPAKGTHPRADKFPILGIKIPDYGGTVVFPEPIENVPRASILDFYSLDKNLQQELIDTAEQGYQMGKLDKREVLWEKRHYLQSFPHALPKILHAAHSWDFACLADLHALLKSWTPLSPLQALELLLPNHPDLLVREFAVKWISEMVSDQLLDFLPQLLQALKHDTYEASPLAALLLRRSLENPRIAHHLYWLLIHSLPGEAPQNMIELTHNTDDTLINQSRYHRRNQLMLRALLAVCGEKMTARFMTQNMMCKCLAEIAVSVKITKESHRLQMLKQGLETVNQILIDSPTSLPLGPAFEVSEVSIRNSSYFNSNTLPLKINFIGPDKQLIPAIFKDGDDLQQDMLTLQIVRVMDKLWLKEGLNLKMVTFNCVPTGYKKGMIECVSDAETLRKIQVEWGLTGSFKDKSIAEWLAKQNPSQLEYQRAVDNFTVSCAGYSVATYILGVCDRHNDNIMLKTSGHLFHIDFGKFLGDAQKFGNFKRDRTPFVLTSDMAYVINGGDRPSIRFHRFVDICCQAFNIVRKHGDLILHMFALMASSGIPGVTAEAVNYVRNALLPGQSNPEAAASFAKMIHISLKSWFTQFNFFLHNIAQMKFSSENDDGELLSFVPRVYTMAQEGRLKSVTVHGYQKRYDLEKYYTYILKVTRQNQPDPAYLFRSYKEFSEFHQKLCLHFPLVRLHSLPSGIHVGRSNIKTVAERRLPEIRHFLISLFESADEISHSDLVYTFFHPLLRDQQEADISARKVRGLQPLTDIHQPLCGEIKLSLQYHREALIVMIHHARSLSVTPSNQEPNTYVKVYLKPDHNKSTKRKTKVVRKNCNPSFMETLEYRLPMVFLHTKVMQVTIWSHDPLQENEFLGGFELKLADLNLREEIIQWYKLGYLPRS